eukprot:Gb_39775 [translate_table: standard]
MGSTFYSHLVSSPSSHALFCYSCALSSPFFHATHRQPFFLLLHWRFELGLPSFLQCRCPTQDDTRLPIAESPLMNLLSPSPALFPTPPAFLRWLFSSGLTKSIFK